MTKEKTKNNTTIITGTSSNNKKNTTALTSSSALNTKELIRDYKTITSSTSTNFNKVEARLERGDSIGNDDTKDSPTSDEKKGKIKRNSSLISLKSINQNLKAMLKITRNDTSSSSDAEIGETIKKKPPQINPPLIATPSLKIESKLCCICV